MSSKALIIPAAGSGKRMGGSIPKPFIALNDGRPVLEHSLKCFSSVSGLRQVIVATSAAKFEIVENMLQRCFPAEVRCQCVQGGTRRQESVYYALQKAEDVDLIMIHDAVRPFIKIEHITSCYKAAEKFGAAVIGIPLTDTVKKAGPDQIVEKTPKRKGLWRIQTPQVFRSEIIREAYNKAAEDNYAATDDASLVEWAGKPVKIVRGNTSNIKITYPHDLKLAAFFLNERLGG